MPRPDFVRCVGYNPTMRVTGQRTWCGSDEVPFFLDAEHAACSGAKYGRLVACPDCVAAIIASLRNGHKDASETTMIKE